MTFEQFVYWLQGFAEISGEVPRKEEWDMIKAHLNTCFNKVTPPKDINKWATDKWAADKWNMPITNPLYEKPISIC